ncbi:MAG TPA: DMT family transporter [Thermoanaerobaculia bacterium]|nr:DMT family transporter [Thermoanaerobaculia bacterium]
MPATRPLRVHLALAFVQLLFAGFAVVGKVVLASMSPLALAGLRVLGATPLLLLLAARRGRPLPAVRDVPRLLLLGLLGVTANQLLFVFGLQRTTATNASILVLAIPVFAVAVGALLGVEKPSPRQLAGVALAVAGALALLHPGRMVLEPATSIGNALILTNCLAYAFFLVLQRPLLDRLPWETVIAWAFLLGGLMTLPLAWHDLVALPARPPGTSAWIGVAYIVLLATFVGYALNTWAVQRSSPSLVAAYTTLQPFFAAGLAVAFLGERLGWAELIGFAMIAGGLGLVTARRVADEPEQAPALLE